MRGRRRGFTMLETLMVTGMVAVVSSIAVPAYFRVVERSRQTEATFVLSLIRASELRYHAEHREFTDQWFRLDIPNPNLSWPRYFKYDLIEPEAGLQEDFMAMATRIPERRFFYIPPLWITRAGAISDDPVMGPTG